MGAFSIINRPFALRALALAALIVLTPFHARAQNITTGLVGHWRLNETSGTSIADSTGTNPGTWMSGTLVSTTGRVNTALVFNGTDSRIYVNPSASINNLFSGGGTWAAWFMANSNGEAGYGRLFDKSWGGGTGPTITMNAGKIGFEQKFTGVDGYWQFNTALTFGQWYHIAVVYDSSSASNDALIYINGALAPSTRIATPTGTVNDDSTQILAIGNINSTGARTWDGYIDEARIYDRALTAADVAKLYAYGQPFTGPMTCDASHAGVMLYNDDLHQMQYCNATNWVEMGREGTGGPATVAVDYTQYGGSCYSVRAPTSPLAGNYSNWDGGQPDNPGAGIEDCAGYYLYGNTKWHNFPCTQANYYACEKDKGAGCPADYDEYNNQCYKVVAETSTSTGALHGHWMTSEPNGGAGENCVYLGRWEGADPGAWVDATCNSNSDIDGYICQKPFGGGCTGGYSANGGQCYKFNAGVVDWDAARTACQADSGDLALDNSASTHTFLLSLFTPASQNAWVGLTDVATEGEWKWVDGTDAASPRTWNDARTICQGEGGDLAMIKDSGTDTFIKSKFDDGADNVYIGATDTAIDQEWRWIDGTIIASPNLTWDEARTVCQNEGGDLAKVPDAGTDAFIRTLYTPGSDDLWIGANDIASDGTWVWTDASPVSYIAAWDGGQPDGAAAENCAFMLRWNGGDWHDVACSSRASFICEVPLGAGCPSTFGETLGGGTGACANPAGVPGEVGFNTAEGVMQYCNGANWIAMGPKSTGSGAPTNGLAAHWQLDETTGTTAADNSVNSNDGTMLSGLDAAADSVSGKVGTALDFDGVNNKIDVGLDATIANIFSGGGTISGWIYPQGWGGCSYGRIMEKATAIRGAGGWSVITTIGGSPTPTEALAFYKGDSGNEAWWVTPYQSISLNTWQHFAVVYDDSNIANNPVIYINGIAQTLNENDAPSGTPDDDSAVTLYIGSQQSGGCGFDGYLDEIRLYDRALSGPEITQLYSATGGTVDYTSNLAAHWKLNETTGTTAADSSSNNNDGAMVGDLNAGTDSVSGKVGTALDFDGIANRVNAGSDATIANIFSGGGTISGWIYPQGWGGCTYGRIMEKATGLYGAGGWSVITTTGGLVTPTEAIAFFKGDSGNEAWWVTPYQSISLNTWQHFAVVYDDSNIANNPVIYINGVAQTLNENDAPSGTPNSDSAVTLYIGSNTGGCGFDGYLDEIRLHDRALSAVDVAALYQSGTARCTAPAGVAGEMIYNADHNIMQYCNGSEWVGIGDAQ